DQRACTSSRVIWSSICEGAMSFADGFLRNTRQHMGFSLGASETYSPNMISLSTSTVPSERQTLLLTSLVPQVYVNVQKKKFTFDLTFNTRYSRYNGAFSNLTRFSQNGTAAFIYTKVRRKTTLQLLSNVVSMYNDPGLLLGASVAGSYQS